MGPLGLSVGTGVGDIEDCGLDEGTILVFELVGWGVVVKVGV